MYHPYQNLEAKRTVKDRRSRADRARQIDQLRGDRGNSLVLLLVGLIVRLGGGKRRESKTKLASEQRSIIKRKYSLAED